MKLRDKIFLAALVLAGITGAVVSYILSTPGLQQCFKDRRIEWTYQNRAAEAAKRGIWGYKDAFGQKNNLFSSMGCKQGQLGYAVVTDFQKALSAPMTSSQSFIPFTSLALRDGTTLSMSMLGSEVFFTLEPGATNEEIVVCTGIDTTNKQATGCTRGLAFSGTSLTGVAANQKTHSSGATVVMSNVHYVYNNYLDKITTSTQSVAGPVTFTYFPAVTSTTSTPATGDQLATKYYVDNVGAGGFTASNVSSTLGLQAITSGVPNCPTAAACAGVNASSSAADNGGFINFASSTGKIFFDVLTFLTHDWSWSGGQTFTGTTTTTNAVITTLRATSTQGLAVTFSPTNTTDVVNMGYALNTVSSNSATGTAAATITAGQAVFITTTSTLVATNTNDATSTFHFVGIAETGGTQGSTITFTRPGGKNCYQSGLLPGYLLYLNGTAGQVSSTAGNKFARIGQSITANCVEVSFPSYMATGTVTINATGDFNIVTGFYPAHIDIRAGAVGLVSNGEIASIGDDTNNAIIFFEANAGQTQNSYQDGSAWYLLQDAGGTLDNAGSVTAKSPIGFTLNAGTHNADAQLQFTAYSL